MGKFEFVLFLNAEVAIPQEKKPPSFFDFRGGRPSCFSRNGALFPAEKKSSEGREQASWFGLEFGFRLC